MPNFPINFGGREVGGFRALLNAARQGILWPWDITSAHVWEAKITAAHIGGAASTQITTITIPASGFVSGRLSLAFSGGPLPSPVSVAGNASAGQTNEDLGNTIETALNIAIAGSLAGVLASVENDAARNVLNLTFVQGVGLVSVVPTFTSAQVSTITFGGTLLDGAYRTTFSGGGLGAAVPATTTRAGGTPANAPAMAIQHEADIEALVGSTLAGVVVSADDNGSGVNTIQFAPGIAAVTIATSVPPGTTLTFGGTETDGAYATTLSHSSIPAGSATVTTIRAAGNPATNADLAAQHELDIEADPRLSAIVASADDTGSANTVAAFAGISGLTIATSAPAPGTLTSSPPTMTVATTTPAGPTVTVTHSVRIELNSCAGMGPFPAHVMRLEVALEVDTVFGSGRTITVGQGDGAATLLGGTPVTLNTTGRTLALASDTHYQARYQAQLVPTATIALGSSLTASTGLAYVQISWTPHPSRTATAA